MFALAGAHSFSNGYILTIVVAAGMHHAIAGASLGPDEQEDVLTIGVAVNLADELLGRSNGLTVDLEDDVARDDAGVIRRTSRPHAADSRTVNLRRNTQLLTDAWAE